MSQPYSGAAASVTDANVYFRGPASAVCLVGPLLQLALWLVVAIVVLSAGRALEQRIRGGIDQQVAGWTEKAQIAELQTVPPVSRVIDWGVVILVWIIALQGVFFFVRRVWRWFSTRYTLTSDRIEIERGIIGKQITNIELWRVKDLDYARSPLDFLLGVGRLRVAFLDGALQGQVIGPLPNAREVYGKLKQARLEAGRKAGAQAVGLA